MQRGKPYLILSFGATNQMRRSVFAEWWVALYPKSRNGPSAHLFSICSEWLALP
jgi:hypothetical protein